MRRYAGYVAGLWASVVAVVALAACAAGPGATPNVAAAAAVVATVSVGPPPVLLAMAPDGRHVYAAANGTLAVIDTGSGAAIAKLRTSANSTGIAVSPDGRRVYVADLFSNTLAVLDATTNTLAAPLNLFVQRFRGGFGWMAISPAGDTAYIANGVNNTLVVVELPSGRGDYVMPDVRPSDVALTADGTTLFVAGCKPVCSPGFVQLYDTRRQQFTAEIEVGGNPYRVAVAPDGTRAYTANLSGPSVSAIDVAAGRTTASIPVPVQPTGLAVSADGATVWVASQTAGALTAIDAAGARVRGSVAIRGARDVVATPDGRRVFVSGGESVYVVNAAVL
ncbi:hypothetical protein L6Q96_20255 [Candidatus Binatia bacterium]|nr:hypothetical protein [Candidatus Binatia bacterium]